MSDYNKKPEGFTEITEKEFYSKFFHYCLKKAESRQMFSDPNDYRSKVLTARLFDLNYDNEKRGIGIIENHPDKPIFFQYGTEWVRLEKEFAAQFAGDNS